MTPKHHLNTIFQEAIAKLTELNVKFESSSRIYCFYFYLPFHNSYLTIWPEQDINLDSMLGSSGEENRLKLKQYWV